MENEPNKKLKDVTAETNGNHQKGHDKEPEIEYVGLKNQGNTCYMNSYLQTLYHLSEFTRLVLKIPTQAQPLKFPDSMQILFNGLYKEDRPKIIENKLNNHLLKYQQTTVELCKSFGWDREDAFQQQDVQEFSCNIIDALEGKVDKHANLKGEIQRLFQGVAKNYIRCQNVNFSSERNEPFFDIQLQVKDYQFLIFEGKKDVYESLQEYTSEELMSGDNQYDTEDPKFGRQDANKGIKFQKLPPILQITLKRFDFDYQKMRLVKILDKYEYPAELDMFDFMDSSVKEKESREDFLYSLYAVLIHSGKQSGSGHYYVFINKLNNWYKFNDSLVDVISELSVLSGGEGGELIENKYNEKLQKVESSTIVKKETAYMLVYVQKKQAKQILRDITDDDIPPQIKNYYEEKKKKMEIDRRNKEFFTVKVLSFSDLAKTNGNSLIFHKEFANSYISTENFDDIGKTIELKNLITLEQFLKKISNQLKCDQQDILLYKITYGKNSELLTNLSHLLQKKMGNTLLSQLLKGSKIFGEPEYALVVLARNPKQGHIILDDIQGQYQNDDEDDDITASVSPVRAEEKNQDEQLKEQCFVVFYKKLQKFSGFDRVISDPEKKWENQLANYVVVRVWDKFEDVLRQIAKQINKSIDYFIRNYKIYIEKEYQANLLELEDIIDKTAYQIFVNRFYGVLVLEELGDYSEVEGVQKFYNYKSNTYQVQFEPIDQNDPIQERKTFELNGDCQFEYVQRIINESFYNDQRQFENIYFQYYDEKKREWDDFSIDEETLVSSIEFMTNLKFGYDDNIKATARGSCVNYKFLLMDHSTQGYLINKPQEKSIIVSKSTQFRDFVKLVEENPNQYLQYSQKENLDKQVQMSLIKRRNPHSLSTTINMNNQMKVMNITSFYKYLYILERPYEEQEDFLIAGNFTDGDGSPFGHPFLMVERKDIKISELHQKINNHFKNKKINKFFDSDIQSVIQKFDINLTFSEEISKYNITEDSEDTLENVAIDQTYNENNFLAIQIKIYGIDLSTNIKKIQSSQN